MNKKDEEIQKKLKDLEQTVLKETHTPQPPSTLDNPKLITSNVLKTTGSSEESISIKSELHYFGGIGMILLGFVLMFQHAQVGTGFMRMLGMGGGGGFGLILIPLVVGLGWLMYDSKNKIAWMLTGGTCVLLVLTILASLILSFPQMSLLQLIMMLGPFAIGGALLLKGVGGPKAIESKLKNLKS